MTDQTEFTHSSTLMQVRAGKGKELQDLLRRELGIPAGVRWFEVRFGSSDKDDAELVVVRCEYLPRERVPDAS